MVSPAVHRRLLASEARLAERRRLNRAMVSPHLDPDTGQPLIPSYRSGQPARQSARAAQQAAQDTVRGWLTSRLLLVRKYGTASTVLGMGCWYGEYQGAPAGVWLA